MPDGRDNRMMVTIENDPNSPVYENKEKDKMAIMQAEAEVVEGFINGVEWTPEAMVDYVYGHPNHFKEEGKTERKT